MTGGEVPVGPARRPAGRAGRRTGLNQFMHLVINDCHAAAGRYKVICIEDQEERILSRLDYPLVTVSEANVNGTGPDGRRGSDAAGARHRCGTDAAPVRRGAARCRPDRSAM
ncbi:unnamed protein product [Chrysodeixis includens]|uniref:Uncharacterized protein n=1 Tax=Chrysodeixis includens TaxID=689277 RepID=A0A9N8KSZ1_CHRIL|nr:unnamed protein product [Chrysodeixis includens]